MYLFALALAQEAATNGGAAADGSTPSASPFGSFLPMIVAMVAIFYFFMIRPQQKQEKKRKDMLNSVSKGDKIVTTGGICGTVVGINEKNVVIKVGDDGVKLEFVRAAIAHVLRDEEQA